MTETDARLPNDESMLQYRTACGRDLSRLIQNARPEAFVFILQNVNLEEAHLVELGRSRRLTPNQFQRLLSHPISKNSYQVKVAIANNPAAPQPMVLPFIKYLLRKDLASVSRNVNLSPAVRKLAEHLLQTRMADLTVGEKMALAREASMPIVRVLLVDPDPRVVRAAISNSLLSESELLPIVNDFRTNPVTLHEVSLSPRWKNQYSIILALARNPSTPSALRQAVMIRLLFQDLLALVENPDLPLDIRVPARKRLRAKIQSLSSKEKMALIESGVTALQTILLDEPDESLLVAAVREMKLKHKQILRLARSCQLPKILSLLSVSPHWQIDHEIIQALSANEFTPRGNEIIPLTAQQKLNEIVTQNENLW